LFSILAAGASFETIALVLEHDPELSYDEDENGFVLSEAFFYPELNASILAHMNPVIGALGRARKRSTPPTLSATALLTRLVDSEETELILRHIAFHYRYELDFSALIIHAASSITSSPDPLARAALIASLDEIRASALASASSRASSRVSANNDFRQG